MKYNLWENSEGGFEHSVEIAPFDTWNADYTIALMVHPLLIQLKENKQGSPAVNDEDVPYHLKAINSEQSPEDGVDVNWFKRFDYVLDEMIFAMGQIVNNHEDEPEYLIYEDGVDIMDYFEQGRSPEVDDEKRAENRAYHARIQNGLRLFGLYFCDLWS